MQDISAYNEFAEEAGLNQTHDKKRRPPEGLELAMFEIVFTGKDIYGPDWMNWWTDRHVGVEFLGKIIWRRYGPNREFKKIDYILPVQGIKNVYFQTGRSVSADVVIMI